MKKISRFDFLRLYLRSFFVQVGFTYERLIAFGFAWTLIPAAKRLCSSARERSDFLKRHLLSFNANPYLAGYAIGAVTKLEEEKVPREQMIRFKELIRGPLGALGDNLIWQNLRPALLILGLVLASTFGVYGILGVWLVFNLYQAYLRARGMVKGYALGLGLSSDLARGHLRYVTTWSGRMGAVLSGMVFVLALASSGRLSQLGRVEFRPTAGILLVLFALFALLASKRDVNPGYALLFLVAFSLALSTVVRLI